MSGQSYKKQFLYDNCAKYLSEGIEFSDLEIAIYFLFHMESELDHMSKECIEDAAEATLDKIVKIRLGPAGKDPALERLGITH